MTWQIGLIVICALFTVIYGLSKLFGKPDHPQHDSTELRRRIEENGKRVRWGGRS